MPTGRPRAWPAGSSRRGATPAGQTRAVDDDLRALRDACTRALTGHGVQRADDLLATIPPGTAVDRYGEGGAVADLETAVTEILGLPAAVYLPSGPVAQQSTLRGHADRRGGRPGGVAPRGPPAPPPGGGLG